uniref:Uncharacterized protein n=1 Tax=Meloidogyne enterolobii TaxID=390850 RepID=A0A6V7UP17_MELEN|nr:unnamed protein product [Meloidogyne enterolobii]
MVEVGDIVVVFKRGEFNNLIFFSSFLINSGEEVDKGIFLFIKSEQQSLRENEGFFGFVKFCCIFFLKFSKKNFF